MAKETKFKDCNKSQLKRELSEVKLLITDHLASQVKINCELKAKLETMHMKCETLFRQYCKLNRLAGKYRELKGSVNVLIQLLRGEKYQDLEKTSKNSPLVEETMTNNSDKQNQPETDESSQSAVSQEKFTMKEVEDKAIETENNETKDALTLTPKYFYQAYQIKRFGVPQPGWERFGPVDSLDDNGIWRFQLANNFKDTWNSLVDKRNVWMSSRFVILPEELSGLTVAVELKGLSDNNKSNLFKIRLWAPDIKENLKLPLPIELSVQVKILSINEKFLMTQKHQFMVDKFMNTQWLWLFPTYAEPDRFLVSFNETRRDQLPEMIFIFTK